MGDAKDKPTEKEEKKPAKWVTRKCCICGASIKLMGADFKEPFTCKECLNKEPGEL